MTHILVKDGRVVVQGGRVLTTANGAPCCCDGGGGDPPCPGVLGFCFRASAVGFTPSSCDIRISDGGGSIEAELVDLLVDGPLPTAGIQSSALNLPFKGLVSFVGQGGVYGTDTTFHFDYTLGCRDNRPIIREARIDVVGGGSSYDITTSSGTGGLVFLWRRTFNQGLFLDNGPVTLDNDLGDQPCASGIVSQTGQLIVEAQFDTNCNQNTPDLMLAAKCDDPAQTIIVDQATSNGFTGIRYQGESYRLVSRASGTPVAVDWVQDVCGGAPEWPVARLCDGTATITYDPDLRPQDGVTLLWGGDRYVPVSAVSSDPPVGATWSTQACPSSGNLCAGLVPNDPRCANPLYRQCPQCAGYDAGRPGPIPTDPALNAFAQDQLDRQFGCSGCGG
jgi:hypothetical protein